VGSLCLEELGGVVSMKWNGTAKETRQDKQDKRALMRDLGKLSELLEEDQTAGAPLPTGLYWDLRYKARDGLKFLRRRSR